MTTDQKLDKLIDLLIEYSEGGETMADLNLKLYELKTEGMELVSECCHAKFYDASGEDELGWNECYRCGKACEVASVPIKTAKTEEIKPDVTTSEEKGWVCRNCMGPVEGPMTKCSACNKPWLPNPGDGCWVIHPAYNSPAQDYWGSPEPTKCQLALWKLGLVFRTKEEAMDKITSLLAK